MRVRSMLLASVVPVFPRAFVNTNSGSKFYVCSVPKETDLTLAQYAALTWTEVGGVGNLGETGTATNVLTYNTWGTKVSQKGKGIANAGDPSLEVARNPADPGQQIMRDGANTNFNYAFKLQRNDPVPGGTVGTVIYNRGIIAGGRAVRTDAWRISTSKCITSVSIRSKSSCRRSPRRKKLTGLTN